MQDVLWQGPQQVIIKGNDTSVKVTALSIFPMLCELGVDNFWIPFGPGDNHSWILVQDVCR